MAIEASRWCPAIHCTTACVDVGDTCHTRMLRVHTRMLCVHTRISRIYTTKSSVYTTILRLCTFEYTTWRPSDDALPSTAPPLASMSATPVVVYILVYDSHVARIFSYVASINLRSYTHSYVSRMLHLCTRMLLEYYTHILICYSCITLLYSYVASICCRIHPHPQANILIYFECICVVIEAERLCPATHRTTAHVKVNDTYDGIYVNTSTPDRMYMSALTTRGRTA